jgi:ferritin-like metal-binding protein YciE
LRQITDRVERDYGRIDVVVANAAIRRWVPLLEMEGADRRDAEKLLSVYRNSDHARVFRGLSCQPLPEKVMAEKDLNALFLDTLKDIYYAEKQIYKSLPKMAKAAASEDLRAAFEKHHDETEGQIERLEKIFEMLGKPARGKKCDAIEGILDEGKEIMEEYKGEPALDAGLLAAAQAVEHYEISRYGTLKTWAGKLGQKDAVRLLEQTLNEEKKTDDALSTLALAAVNDEAG